MNWAKAKRILAFSAIASLAVLLAIAIHGLFFGFGGGDGTIDSLSKPDVEFIVRVEAIPEEMGDIRLIKVASYTYRKFHRGWTFMLSGVADTASLKEFWKQYGDHDNEGWPSYWKEDPGQIIRSRCERSRLVADRIDSGFSKDDLFVSTFSLNDRNFLDNLIFDPEDGRFTFWTDGSWDNAK